MVTPVYYFSPSRLVFNKDNKIWVDAVEVTEERFEELRQEMMEGRILEAGVGNAPSTRAPETPFPVASIQSVYQNILAVMNNDYEIMVAYLKQTYPLSEVITWSIQRDESVKLMAWLAEDTSRTVEDFPRALAPFIYDLAAQRTVEGISGGIFSLAERVLTNDAIFSPALATITARRHGAEKQMLAAVAADDRVALKAVTWSFSLQG